MKFHLRASFCLLAQRWRLLPVRPTRRSSPRGAIWRFAARKPRQLGSSRRQSIAGAAVKDAARSPASGSLMKNSPPRPGKWLANASGRPPASLSSHYARPGQRSEQSAPITAAAAAAAVANAETNTNLPIAESHARGAISDRCDIFPYCPLSLLHRPISTLSARAQSTEKYKQDLK